MSGTNGAGSPVRLLGIGGSTRRRSGSLAALRATLRLAEAAGAATALADVRALGLPLYDEERALPDYPASLGWLLTEARAADGLLLCSPTYLGTVAGATKNVLDLLSLLAGNTPSLLGGRPVGLMATGGANAFGAIDALGQAARSLNGLAVPTVVMVGNGAIGPTGEIAHEATRRRLDRMVAEVIDLARRLRPTPGVAGALPPTRVAQSGRGSEGPA